MKQEDRKKLFDALKLPTDSSVPEKMQKELKGLIGKDLDAIEPIIDEMVGVPLTFHEAVQVLAFLKFHEWREPRPGYHDCPECHIEFQATPDTFRRHRDRCRVGELIKILQAKIQTYEGSKSHAVSENKTSTTG